MKLIDIKNSLNKRLTIFNNVEEVKQWLTDNKFSIESTNMKMHIEKGNEYIKKELNKRTEELNELLENHKIRLSLNYDTSNSYDKKQLLSDIAKVSLIGGIIGVALFGAAAFLTGAVIAFVGHFFVNSYNSTNEVAKKIFNNSQEASKKLIKEYTELINKLMLLDNEYRSTLEKPQIPHISIKSTDTKEVKELKEFFNKRNIKYLIHFTDGRNIESIKKYGILSVNELQKKNLFFYRNDYKRLDGVKDGISLSITTSNTRVFKQFIQNGTLKNPKMIVIDVRLLWEEINTKRYYCDRNAACGTVQKGSDIKYLYNMFRDNISYNTWNNSYNYNRFYDGTLINEPTDSQAEILFLGRIDPKYILEITDLN